MLCVNIYLYLQWRPFAVVFAMGKRKHKIPVKTMEVSRVFEIQWFEISHNSVFNPHTNAHMYTTVTLTLNIHKKICLYTFGSQRTKTGRDLLESKVKV